MDIVLASDPGAIDRAITILRSGGVVAHATETCYGFACDLTNPNAVQKLFQIKDRPADQPVSVLFPNLTTATEWVIFSDRARAIAEKHLPGPLTLILSVSPKAAPLFVTADKKPAKEIGIRVSSHPLAQEIAKKFDHPIATTSANLHGQANPYSLDDIVRQFEGKEFQPDLILDNGTLLSALPSTVIRVAGDRVETVRKGDVQIS